MWQRFKTVWMTYITFKRTRTFHEDGEGEDIGRVVSKPEDLA